MKIHDDTCNSQPADRLIDSSTAKVNVVFTTTASQAFVKIALGFGAAQAYQYDAAFEYVIATDEYVHLL